MELQFNEYLALDDVQVRVDKNGIFVPVDVEHKDLNRYHGEARSFGYNFDGGPCTIVTYEQVMGVLAEDAQALIEEYNEIRKHSQKPNHTLLDFDEREDVGFDKNKAELLIRYGNDLLYKCGDRYFYIHANFPNDPSLVTNESAELYREVNAEYQRQVAKYNRLVKQSQENLRELKKIAVASYDS